MTDGQPQAARPILADAQSILAYLPDRIRIALITGAAAIEYPIEAFVEMSIALYLFFSTRRRSLFGMERSARSQTNRIIQAKVTRRERSRSRTNRNRQEEGRQREKAISPT
ncbi:MULTISPECIES: hypothetical protein [unclassified Microcoleus]|uniref:hypothetical protein n=1 Tax=unclassified Microcoleus TaxID=2642155 RepID=UPI002FD13597